MSSSFFDFLGDALVPNEIAPYLGMLAPMVAPQLGIVGSLALSQLGSMKMNEGAFDPYSAIATGIALSSPQARAIRRAGRLDPTRGTVGQRLSAGIAASLPAKKVSGLDKAGAFYRALDPRLSIRKNKFGNYYENPMSAQEAPSKLLVQGRLHSPFDKSKFQGENTLMSDTAFNKRMQETIDYTYGKEPALGDDFQPAQAEVKDQTLNKTITESDGTETKVKEIIEGSPYKDPVFGSDTNLTAEQQEAYLDIYKDKSLSFSEKEAKADAYLKSIGKIGSKETFFTKAADMGSAAAGAIMPGFSDYDPLTGEFREFNFEKALLTVGVATTLGGLNQIAEELKKQKDMDEQQEREIWKEWFDSYERTSGKPYSQSRYPDEFLMEKYNRYMLASGGRVGYNMGGGIMAAAPGVPQGMQVDGRNGTFIPMGVEEKADDVPAMLSKNEFVMTADAVKAAGDGDANVGAQRMYDLMHSLEAQV